MPEAESVGNASTMTFDQFRPFRKSFHYGLPPSGGERGDSAISPITETEVSVRNGEIGNHRGPLSKPGRSGLSLYFLRGDKWKALASSWE